MRGRLLKGKIALITGGSGGMGSSTAREFASEGAEAVCIQYLHSKEKAGQVAREVEAMGCKSLIAKADVSQRSEAFALVDKTLERFGRLDAVLCFAGHPFRREEWFAPFESLGEREILASLQVDLLGSIFVAQAAIPSMRRQRSGKIVFVASTPAITGDEVGHSYLIAKSGILGLTKALAQYLGPYNVHVNAIAPGSIDTEAMVSLTSKERKELAKYSALKRLGTAKEVARKAVFLCSEDSDFLTGMTLVVDGGYAMR